MRFSGSFVITAALILMLAAPKRPAVARDYDMLNTTCKQVTDADPEDMELYFAWSVGYLAGKRGASELKGDNFERLIKRVRRFCLANPAAPLVKTIDDMSRSN